MKFVSSRNKSNNKTYYYLSQTPNQSTLKSGNYKSHKYLSDFLSKLWVGKSFSGWRDEFQKSRELFTPVLLLLNIKSMIVPKLKGERNL